MQISVQIVLNWNWPTGTELGKNLGFFLQVLLSLEPQCDCQPHAHANWNTDAMELKMEEENFCHAFPPIFSIAIFKSIFSLLMTYGNKLLKIENIHSKVQHKIQRVEPENLANCKFFLKEISYFWYRMTNFSVLFSLPNHSLIRIS